MKGAIHRRKVEQRKPLSREQVADFARALEGYATYRTNVVALRLMLLTFVRTVELRAADWCRNPPHGCDDGVICQKKRGDEL